MQLNPHTPSKLLELPNDALSYAFQYLSFLNVSNESAPTEALREPQIINGIPQDEILKLVNHRIYSIVCHMLSTINQKFAISSSYSKDPAKIVRFFNSCKITEIYIFSDILWDSQSHIDILKLMIKSLSSELIRRIEKIAFFSGKQSEDLLSLFSLLKNISILSAVSLLDRDVVRFLTIPKLESLSLNKGLMMTSNVLSAITTNTTLTNLNFTSCNITEVVAQKAAICFPNLANLTIAYSQARSGTQLRLNNWVTNFTSLTSLTLSNNKILNDDDIKYVASIPTLCSLQLERLSLVTTIHPFLNNNLLTVLVLISLKRLSTFDIGPVITTLANLTHLVIKQCFVDNDIIDYIRQCTSLKRLECVDKNLTYSNNQMREFFPDVVIKKNNIFYQF